MNDELRLRDPEDFPALYQRANAASLAGQKRFLNYFRIRLGALLVAAITGAIAFKVGDVAIGAALAVVAFLTALAIDFLMSQNKPERSWYEGRAAAESAKTLTWRFAVGGESFPSGLDGIEARRLLISKLKEITHDLDGLQLSNYAEEAPEIADRLLRLRAQSFEERKSNYKVGRIEEQRGWYARKSKWNGSRAHNWTIAVVCVEFAGVLFGTLAAFGVIEFDVLGFFAAVAATMVAWIQAKQYRNLATAYDITSQELSSISAELDLILNEDDWPKFVGQSEEAISREHTLWRASRGIKVTK